MEGLSFLKLHILRFFVVNGNIMLLPLYLLCSLTLEYKPKLPLLVPEDRTHTHLPLENLTVPVSHA